MASSEGYFTRCMTSMEVHNELRTLLLCDFLKPDDASLKFRMNCWSDIPGTAKKTWSVEKLLIHLEEKGMFSEGNYDFIKRKVENMNVAVTDLIIQAEEKIEEIRDSALQVTTLVTNVEHVSLEKQTRASVDLILLTVHEKLLCRSEMSDEELCSLLDRHNDLGSKSEQFLQVWHNEYCRCRKYYGQQLLLKYVTLGAKRLEEGEARYDKYRRKLFPKLLDILKSSANIILHVFEDCGGSQVSLASSSVHSYWLFDSVDNLDKLWRKYKDEGLHFPLQKCLNTMEMLELLNVDSISLKITIDESDYLKYRHTLDCRTRSTTRGTQSLGYTAQNITVYNSGKYIDDKSSIEDEEEKGNVECKAVYKSGSVIGSTKGHASMDVVVIRMIQRGGIVGEARERRIFIDQYGINCTCDAFAKDGDSGSLVLLYSASGELLGLGMVVYRNKFMWVMDNRSTNRGYIIEELGLTPEYI